MLTSAVFKEYSRARMHILLPIASQWSSTSHPSPQNVIELVQEVNKTNRLWCCLNSLKWYRKLQKLKRFETKCKWGYKF